MSCVVHMYYRLPYTVNLLNIKLLHVKNTLTYLDMLQESTGNLVCTKKQSLVTVHLVLCYVLLSVYTCVLHTTHTPGYRYFFAFAFKLTLTLVTCYTL